MIRTLKITRKTNLIDLNVSTIRLTQYIAGSENSLHSIVYLEENDMGDIVKRQIIHPLSLRKNDTLSIDLDYLIENCHRMTLIVEPEAAITLKYEIEDGNGFLN